MEKTLIIDNKEIKFKSTAATPLRYKAQFQSDFFKDLINIDGGKKIAKNKDDIDMTSIDIEVIYNIIWILAKTADKNIPDPLHWYDSFDEFDFEEVFTELQDLILKSISSKKK